MMLNKSKHKGLDLDPRHKRHFRVSKVTACATRTTRYRIPFKDLFFPLFLPSLGCHTKSLLLC